MIGLCSECGDLFETTTEDACTPATMCPRCYLREVQAEADRRKLGLPTIKGTRAMFDAIDRAREAREARRK